MRFLYLSTLLPTITFVETHKSAPPKVPEDFPERLCRICEPVPGVSRRNFRDRQFPLPPEATQSASVSSGRFFRFRAQRRVSLIRYGRHYHFLSLTFPSAACGRANFRPQAAWGSGAFAPASGKNVHFCDACTFLSLAENPFFSEPPDNVVYRFAPSNRLS